MPRAVFALRRRDLVGAPSGERVARAVVGRAHVHVVQGAVARIAARYFSGA